MIILIGECGSGKTSILNELIKNGYSKDDVVCLKTDQSIDDVKEKAAELGFDAENIKSFYIFVPAEERTKRMLSRGDSIETIQMRMKIDSEKFKGAKETADFVIKNEILEEAVNEIIKLDRG